MELSGGLRIREATPADYATYLRLFAEMSLDDPPPSLEAFAATFAPGTLFAELDGEPVGYAYHRLMDGSAHLAQIATASAARRRGVGRALMEATIARVKQHGAKALQLNVVPTNAAAIALYASFGLREERRSWAFWMDWAAILKQPAPFVADVRTPEPAEDAAWESRLGMPKGLFAMARRVPTRVFRVLGADALIGFDTEFPGAFPFNAPDAATAFSLLHAVHGIAKPEKDPINVTIDSDEMLKDAFVAAGARLRFEMLRLRGSI